MRWCLALSLVLATTACGLPDEERSRTVDADVVPYNLLTPADRESDDSNAGPAHPRGEPVVFWLRGDGRLTTAPVGATCDDPVAQVVEGVLGALSASPSSEESGAGRTSAVPPSARLKLVALEDGVAVVDLDPVALGDAERLPLAVGQLVLSVSSAPGVEGLRLVTSGEAVDVPLPDGALAERTVTSDDYVELLSPGLVSGTGDERTLAGDVGCPT